MNAAIIRYRRTTRATYDDTWLEIDDRIDDRDDHPAAIGHNHSHGVVVAVEA